MEANDLHKEWTLGRLCKSVFSSFLPHFFLIESRCSSWKATLFSPVTEVDGDYGMTTAVGRTYRKGEPLRNSLSSLFNIVRRFICWQFYYYYLFSTTGPFVTEKGVFISDFEAFRRNNTIPDLRRIFEDFQACCHIESMKSKEYRDSEKEANSADVSVLRDTLTIMPVNYCANDDLGEVKKDQTVPEASKRCLNATNDNGRQSSRKSRSASRREKKREKQNSRKSRSNKIDFPCVEIPATSSLMCQEKCVKKSIKKQRKRKKSRRNGSEEFQLQTNVISADVVLKLDLSTDAEDDVDDSACSPVASSSLACILEFSDSSFLISSDEEWESWDGDSHVDNDVWKLFQNCGLQISNIVYNGVVFNPYLSSDGIEEKYTACNHKTTSLQKLPSEQEMSSSVYEANIRWKNGLDKESKSDKCLKLPSNTKKVRFASDLCKVHRVIAWSFAYRAARKGPWEAMARDRERFQMRILSLQPIINPILSVSHRHFMRAKLSDWFPEETIHSNGYINNVNRC